MSEAFSGVIGIEPEDTRGRDVDVSRLQVRRDHNPASAAGGVATPPTFALQESRALERRGIFHGSRERPRS
jgi:hypothetical protein